ncbi:hypothetical protein [Caulobacter sp. BK020]|uniref:hypothetical protein n=1 Tax=Caulobacter sp. BK020 TaxID=2512117 RepID=UPI00104A23AB|nr:hypothetical protein [Caulobacter sp. BK020]TCS03875.1 hypothetical protein EV278_13326 [Caulobacter sp. BK020]
MSETATPPIAGVAYVPSSAQPVTEWSAVIYKEFQHWPAARSGHWEWWNQDYLVLRIGSHLGDAVEEVLIDTCDDELTVTFGYWETHLPDDGLSDDTDSFRAANVAKELIVDWLAGKTATAIYFSAADKWCGSKYLENPHDLSGLADIAWIESFNPTRVEVRRARKADWRFFDIIDGNLQDTPRQPERGSQP